jgi:polysaccharide biosynthesis transport protein
MPLPKADLTHAQFSLLSLARMCWMHRVGILVGWSLFTALAVAIVYRLPAIYSADALVLIDAQKIPERLVPTTVSADAEDRLASISQEILSNTRLKKIIDDYDLYREERKTRPLDEIVQKMRGDIASHVKLERGWGNNKPDAFRVGYEGKDPAVVAQVANQLANLFIEENLRSREGQAEGTSEFISTQVVEAKKKLDALETTIREFKSAHNGELPEQQGALQGALNRLQMEQRSDSDAISRAEDSKATMEKTVHMAEETVAVLMRPPATRGAGAIASAMAPDGAPLPVAPRKQSEVLQEQLAGMLGHYGEEHPEMKRLRVEIAKARAAEAAAEKRPAAASSKSPGPVMAVAPDAAETSANPVEVGQARERVETLKSQIVLLDKEIASRTADQQRVLREIAEYQGKLNGVPLREQELTEIARDYEVTKVNYHSLLEKQISAEMSTDMERRQKSERFTIIDPAHVPERPSKPNRPFFITVGSLFGFVLVLTGAIGLEIRKDRLLGDWELPQGVPVLARVPRISMDEAGSAFWRWKTWGKPRRAVVASSALLVALAPVVAWLYLNHWF